MTKSITLNGAPHRTGADTIADLVRDQALIPHIQKLASHVMAQAPEKVDAIILRWLGHRQHYVQA